MSLHRGIPGLHVSLEYDVDLAPNRTYGYTKKDVDHQEEALVESSLQALCHQFKNSGGFEETKMFIGVTAL